jgi:hypothetical protein
MARLLSRSSSVVRVTLLDRLRKSSTVGNEGTVQERLHVENGQRYTRYK